MSSNFSRTEREFATEVTEKLYQHPLAKVFLQPVNPELDGALDYLQKISKPMDLGTIKQKLSNNEYSNAEEWRSDVNLVWSNAKTYNPKTNLIFNCADQMQKVTEKLIQKIPKDENEKWHLRLNKLNTKIQELLKNHPSETCFLPFRKKP